MSHILNKLNRITIDLIRIDFLALIIFAVGSYITIEKKNRLGDIKTWISAG